MFNKIKNNEIIILKCIGLYLSTKILYNQYHINKNFEMQLKNNKNFEMQLKKNINKINSIEKKINNDYMQYRL